MIRFAVFSVFIVSMVPARENKAKPQDSQVQQNQSVVDAAKRSRELKKNVAPARVITNDDLDKEHPKLNQDHLNVGVLMPPQTESSHVMAASKAPPYEGATLASDESGSKDNESIEAATEVAEIAKLKAQLASAESALYWQQRELLLDQNTIYSNPRYTTTHVGEAELDSARLQIERNQQEIDRLKGPLANLEWRHWRRMQADCPENGTVAENCKSVPPSALVLPSP
jgi:hypothetical protein